MLEDNKYYVMHYVMHYAMHYVMHYAMQVPGAMLEDNKYALSVHTRNVSAADLPRLDELVQGVLEEQPLLRRSEGKHVIELKPQVDRHRGCSHMPRRLQPYSWRLQP